MTAEELRAIRQRSQKICGMDHVEDVMAVQADVAALLAEVDRLQHLEGVIADLETRHGDGAECCADPPCKIGEVMKVVRSRQAAHAPCCMFDGGLRF